MNDLQNLNKHKNRYDKKTAMNDFSKQSFTQYREGYVSLLKMRREKVKTLLDKAYEIKNSLRPSKGSNLGTVVTYANNQKDKLYLFFDDPKVVMSNNCIRRRAGAICTDYLSHLHGVYSHHTKSGIISKAHPLVGLCY